MKLKITNFKDSDKSEIEVFLKWFEETFPEEVKKEVTSSKTLRLVKRLINIGSLEYVVVDWNYNQIENYFLLEIVTPLMNTQAGSMSIRKKIKENLNKIDIEIKLEVVET